MKANEFLRDNGLTKCSRIVDDLTEQEVDSDFVKDLKRLIESHEIVEYIGNDLDGAKQVYAFTKDCVHIAMRDRMIPVIRLKQAIADVESCQ